MIFRNLALFLCLAFTLFGCGGSSGGGDTSGGDDDPGNTPPPVSDDESTSSSVNDDVITAGEDEVADIIVVSEEESGSPQVELDGDLADSVEAGSLLYVLPDDDNRFPFGLTGRVADISDSDNGTKIVELEPVSYAEVVSEATFDLTDIPLDADNFVGVIAPSAVQASTAGVQMASSVASYSFRNGAVTIGPSGHGGRQHIQGADDDVINAGKVSLNMEVNLEDMDTQASTKYPLDTKLTGKFVITGELDNIKLTNQHDFSLFDGLKSLDLRVDGDFKFDVNLSGNGSVKFGYFSQAWNEVASESMSLLGVTGTLNGLSSDDKIGNYPLAGLVWSVPCPTTCPVVTGTTQTPLRQAKAMGVIVWVYLTLEGELSLEGEVSLARLGLADLSLGVKKENADSDLEMVRSLNAKNTDGRLIEAPGLNGSLGLELKGGITTDIDFFVSGVRLASAGMDIAALGQMELTGEISYGTESLSSPWSWQGTACFSNSIGAGVIARAAARVGVEINTSWGDPSFNMEYELQIPTDDEISEPGWHGLWYTASGYNICWPGPQVSLLTTTIADNVATVTVSGENLPGDLDLSEENGRCSNMDRQSHTASQVVYTCQVDSWNEFRYQLSSSQASNLDSSSAAGFIYLPEPDCTDADEDGYNTEGGDCGEIDCDDSDPDIHPNAAEICGDGIDQDCSGADLACEVTCTDVDGDGYFVEGGDCGAVDCDDSDTSVNPGATEICDSQDNDCDDDIDDGDVRFSE